MSDSEVITLEEHSQIVKYCRLAPAALWFFDYCLTFDDELRVMWLRRRWGFAHALFILTRYLPLVGFICAIYDSVTPHLALYTCLPLYKTYGCILLVIMVVTEALLLIRTLALWNDNKIVKYTLTTLYTLVSIAVAICAGVSMSLDLYSVCSSSEAESSPSAAAAAKSGAASEDFLITGAFSGVAFFELVVLCLTIYHGLVRRSLGASSRNRLATSLRQGNLVYAASLFTMSVVNNVFFVLPLDAGWAGLLDVFQGVLHGVMASRIMFDLRDADKSGSTDAYTVSSMQFASIPMTVLPEHS
ncbi:hypothetical protein BV22DRAFT_1131506 [Leucogyrophana mollusca]|uniref:Uncharacterized protein n=1 Tax=Leucogyrophana mollusca TaxID=85980 RepID=A0ACB8B9H7_9AGAM|nr:hypothetical protein BV22DRAFT_1131506 [Leucogyrophana mollusca]